MKTIWKEWMSLCRQVSHEATHINLNHVCPKTQFENHIDGGSLSALVSFLIRFYVCGPITQTTLCLEEQSVKCTTSSVLSRSNQRAYSTVKTPLCWNTWKEKKWNNNSNIAEILLQVEQPCIQSSIENSDINKEWDEGRHGASSRCFQTDRTRAMRPPPHHKYCAPQGTRSMAGPAAGAWSNYTCVAASINLACWHAHALTPPSKRELEIETPGLNHRQPVSLPLLPVL